MFGCSRKVGIFGYELSEYGVKSSKEKEALFDTQLCHSHFDPSLETSCFTGLAQRRAMSDRQKWHRKDNLDRHFQVLRGSIHKQREALGLVWACERLHILVNYYYCIILSVIIAIAIAVAVVVILLYWS